MSEKRLYNEKTYIIEAGDKPTEEMLEEVRAAAEKPIVFGEDCPELSPAVMKEFECAATQRNKIALAWIFGTVMYCRRAFGRRSYF